MTLGQGRERLKGRSVITFVWLAFVSFIIYGSTFPFQFTSDPAFVLAKLRGVSLNPLISPDTGRRLSIPDVVQNVLLYVPFGVLGVLTLKKPRRTLSLSRTSCILFVVFLAALLSATIETIQLFTPDRTTSLADLLTNSLGALCGALTVPAVTEVAQRLMARPGIVHSVRTPRFYLFAIAMVVLCVSAWAPFDVALDVGSVWAKLKALGTEPFGAPSVDAQFVLYLLLAMAASSWFQQIGIRPAAFFAGALAVVVAVGLEATKFLVESRMPSVEGATMHAAGAVVGAILATVGARMRPAIF